MHNISSPRRDDDAIESEIKAKGKTAPRVTPSDLEAQVASEHYFTAADGAAGASGAEKYGHLEEGAEVELSFFEAPQPLELLTFCVLVLKNGFTVTGESACASPENFDAELGKKIARQAAVNKLWPLLGYELRTKLAQEDAE